MKRIVSLFLALLIFSSNVFFIVSCGKNQETYDSADTCFTHIDKNSDNLCDKCSESLGKETPPKDSNIKVPEYKDYLRGTKDFDTLFYSRPDINAALILFDSVSKMISENTLSYSEQLSRLNEVDAVYKNVKSMNSLATIYNHKNSTNEYWKTEYHYITTNFPKFSQGIEKIFVSAANSPHIDNFEKDFFGDGLEAYINGGIYTDTLVELMRKEAEIEAEYSSISTANVIITYGGMTDTYDAVLSFYKEKYGENSTEYLKARTLCDAVYKDEVAKIESELLVELIKIRKSISDTLGYKTYEQYAYETIYHDYSPEKAEDFINSVIKNVLPVYLNLSKELFAPYIYNYEKIAMAYKPEKSELINTLFNVYTSCDAKLGEIYSYMLQHKLYDIEAKNNYRFDGSFTTYIDTNASPFLFMTLGNSILDFSTLAHEFGHFADEYLNNDGDASLDLLEVSSQALELLTLTKLDTEFDEETYRYFLYLKLDEILSTIIFQSFYASFEINAYKLDYEDITVENLNGIVAKLAKDFGFSSNCNSVEYVSVPHIFLYPFYVQSYATSAAAALEIYTLELKNEGDGFAAYNKLLARNGETALSFEVALLNAGLSSPFDSSELRRTLNELHYATLGAYFYKSHNNNAA